MAKRLTQALAGLAGLAVVAVPGVVMPGVAPADAQCTGGICEICPAVAQALRPVGTQIACLA